MCDRKKESKAKSGAPETRQRKGNDERRICSSRSGVVLAKSHCYASLAVL